MQALILAAGFGRRLQPLTNHMPKSLTEIHGTPLLINALNHLSVNGITEVIIVVGHMKDKIIEAVGHTYNGMKIIYIENPVFDKTNNIYSFYLTKNYINNDILMLECDLFYNDELVKTILKGKAECNILVSPYDNTTMDGTVIEADSENNAKALIIKKYQEENFDYSHVFKTVNVYKFSKQFILYKFMPMVETYVKTQSVNSYYELVLGSIIYYGNDDIKIVHIGSDKWAEVDDMQDLKIAEEKFQNE